MKYLKTFEEMSNPKDENMKRLPDLPEEEDQEDLDKEETEQEPIKIPNWNKY
jgi:hypothetical protein